MVMSKVTPVSFHNLVRSANHSSDNIPTYYRANTRRRLRQLAANAGYRVHKLQSLSASFMYYSFNNELFLLMRALSKWAAAFTTRGQQTLLCVLRKP
jgi:hypothetical protein